MAIPTSLNLGKIIVGGIVTTALSLAGWGIVNNDIRNTKEHITIRHEMIAGDAFLRDKIDEIKDIALDIRAEQRTMKVLIEKRL